MQFRLHCHDAYTDPLGWINQPGFSVNHFCLEELTNLLKQTGNSKSTILVIDSLSWVLRHLSPPAVCKTLHQLRKGEKLSSWCRLICVLSQFLLVVIKDIKFCTINYLWKIVPYAIKGKFCSFPSFLTALFCVFIRGSCESCDWSAACWLTSEGYCRECVSLGVFSYPSCTWDKRRWSFG